MFQVFFRVSCFVLFSSFCWTLVSKLSARFLLYLTLSVLEKYFQHFPKNEFFQVFFQPPVPIPFSTFHFPISRSLNHEHQREAPMISVKVKYIPERVFQPKIEATKSSFRKLKIIITIASTFKNHLSIVSSDWNLFYNDIVFEIRHSIIASHRWTCQIQITSCMQIDVSSMARILRS